MTTQTNMTYGSYSFDPVPLLSISVNPVRDANTVGHGLRYVVSFEGDLIYPLESGTNALYSGIHDLRQALQNDGDPLIVTCGPNILISGYPIISDYKIDRANDNLFHRAKYSITYELPALTGTGADTFNNDSGTFPPFIESVDESWDIEFADDRIPRTNILPDGTSEKFGYKLVATHNVTVKARPVYTGTRVTADIFRSAVDYTSGLLGYDSDRVNLTGLLNLSGGNYFSTYDVFNQYRKISSNKANNTVQASETFIISPSGINSLPNNAIETYDVDVNRSDGSTTISIKGNIVGLTSISYTPSGLDYGSGKFEAASGYYNAVKPNLYQRALDAFNIIHGTGGVCNVPSLSPIAKTQSLGLNPIDGSISYALEFDNTPIGCITGECIYSSNISIEDQLASDVVAEQVVLGRAIGPILQDIGTKTSKVRTVNIELVTTPPTSCASVSELYKPIPTGQIDAFLATISGDLTGNYSQVFIVTNSQNWNFSIGRYTRTVGFKYSNCSG